MRRFLSLLLFYILLALTHAADFTEVTPDKVYNYYLPQASSQCFRVPLTKTKSLTVTVTPLANGDPDLYLQLGSSSAVPADCPDATAPYKSHSFGEDSITVPHTAYSDPNTDTAFFTVRAFSATNFTLVVSFEGVIDLADGVPQGGFVHVGAVDHYTYIVPPVASAVTLTINAVQLQGNVRLYVSGNKDILPIPSDPSTYDWTSTDSLDGATVTIYIPNTLDRSFAISVLGHTDAYYSITAALDTTNVILRDRIPITYQVPEKRSLYFTYNLEGSNCSLGIYLTSITGDPDLFVSRSVVHPDESNYDAKSQRFGNDSIVFTHAESGPYYIAVSGWRASTFSLVASSSCDGEEDDPYIIIMDGSPLRGVLNQGRMAYYRFYVQNPHTEVSISVSREYGDPDLFVHNDPRLGLPDWTNAMWSSDVAGDDFISIYDTDANYCPKAPATSCYYLIGVYAAEATSYTIQASTGDAIITLRDGVPMVENLQANSYEYFQIPLDTPGKILTVSVTDLGSGDPDLFISTKVKYPNSTVNTWSAQRPRGDSITIPPTDPSYCAPCTYYISVYAFTNTTFTIVAFFDQEPTLVDGVPQYGEVERGAMDYFDYFIVPGESLVEITLTTFAGRTNLYVSKNGKNPVVTDPSTYQYFLPWYSGSKLLQIENGCPSNSSERCRFIIGIYGILNSSYSIVASTEFATVPLQNGVPFQSSVTRGQYAYFSYRVDNSGNDVAFVLTALSGDPDMYISRNNSRPNATDHEYASARYGSDTVEITNAAPGIYYIAVMGYSNNSTFTIMAVLSSANDDQNLISLIVGQPQSSLVLSNRWVYYSFLLFEPVDDLTLTLTRFYGDPDIYVSTDGRLPNHTHYDYMSTSVGDDFLFIKNPKPAQYLIGIFAYTTSSFTITATTSSDLTQLQDGVPVQGNLDSGEYQYYKIFVDKCDVDLTVTVTPLSGDPDLFMDNRRGHEHPNSTTGNYLWRATSYQGDSLTIPHDDPNACCHCDYYISVYSFTASRYTLMASFHTEIALIDGYPQQGSVEKHAWLYYHFQPSPGISSITFTLTPYNGNPSMFIDTRGLPTLAPDGSQDQAYSFFSTVSITVTPASDYWCASIPPTDASTPPEDCVYFIGIYGNTASSYSLTATTSDGAIVLQAGKPLRSSVLADHYQYFYYINNDVDADLTFLLTSITGDPDMYISHTTTHPNATNWEYRSILAGSDAVIITNAAQAIYYVGVVGYVNCSFTMTAYVSKNNETQGLTRLVDGSPQFGSVPSRSWHYYLFTVSEPHSSVSFIATRQVGDPDLYILKADSDYTRPNLTHYDYKSTAYGKDSVVIYNPEQADYIIGVYGYSTTVYQIVAVSSDAALALLDGVPFRKDLQAGVYEYFELPLINSNKDLTVTVTSLNGDPDLFISEKDRHPNFANHTWAAVSYREDSITIRREDLAKIDTGVLYVSVYAFSNCTFTIVATFSEMINLQDGVPQDGTVAKEAISYFRLEVGAGVNEISVSLMPYTGNAYLYVSSTERPDPKKPETYQWASRNYGTSQSIILAPGKQTPDPFIAPGVYYIGVYGVSNASFQLTASTAKQVTTLTDGIPVQGRVAYNNYTYYTFEVLNPIAAVAFTVTALSGDPDLYVSNTITHPTVSNYTWSSILLGSDALYIDYQMPGYSVGQYFIGVRGASSEQNSVYTILATVIDLSGTVNNTDTVLVNGQAQVGVLAKVDDVQYFRFLVPPSDVGVIISVTAFSGDPDIFIRTDGQKPTRTFYQYSATSSGGDTVTIEDGPNRPAYGGVATEYLIAVIAYSHSFFSITARTTDTVTALQSGVPVQGRTERDQYSYYSISVTDPVPALIVSISTYSGDPDVFIGKGYKPNMTDFDERGINAGSDVLQIDNPTPGATYYIAIYGFRNSSYSIVATLGALYFSPGQQVSDLLSHSGDHRLFALLLTDPDLPREPITISLSLGSTGSVDMFVTNNGSVPTPDTFQWSTTGAVSLPNTIIIYPDDEHYCNNCTYYVATYAQYRTSYTLSAIFGEQNTQLLSGYPVSAVISRGKWRYFTGRVDSGEDVYIVATLYRGDVAIFVSTEHNPTFSTSQWNSTKIPSGASVKISHKDAHYKSPSEYYIGVYGLEDSAFSITFSDDEVQLVPGVPQIGLVQVEGAYFFIEVTEPQDISLMFTEAEMPADRLHSVSKPQNLLSKLLSLFSPSNQLTASTAQFDVYISNEHNNTHPSSLASQWHHRVSAGAGFTISKNDPQACKQPCTYYIGVFGTDDEQANTAFSIRATTAQSTFVLKNDEPHSSVITVPDSYQYYTFSIGRADNFTVILEPCRHNADLYISQNFQYPTKTAYEQSATSKSEIDIIYFPLSLRDITFSIGVYAELNPYRAPTSYQITATTKGLPATRPIISSSALVASTPAARSISVQFHTAQSQIGSSAALKYIVYHTKLDTPGAVMYTRCGLQLTTASKTYTFPNKAPGELVSVTIDNLEPNTFYSLNVMVFDADNDQSYSLYTAQPGVKTLSDDEAKGGGVNAKLVVAVVIPIAIVVVIVVGYLVYRNRQLSKELEVEMHDVPKSIVRKAVRGPEAPHDVARPNRDAHKYSTLLTEDEDDFEGSDYAPPTATSETSTNQI